MVDNALESAEEALLLTGMTKATLPRLPKARFKDVTPRRRAQIQD